MSGGYEFTAAQVTRLVNARARAQDATAAAECAGQARAARASRLGMARATADELEAHILRYYPEPEALRFIVGVADVDREVRYLAEGAAALFERLATSG